MAATHTNCDMVINTTFEPGSNGIIGGMNTIFIGGGNSKEGNMRKEDTRNQEREEPVVTQESNPEPEAPSFVYEMKKGHVVLIHNERYHERDEVWRRGSKIDSEGLKKFFQTDRGFTFREHEDCKASRIQEIAKDVSERDFSKNDSFFFIILGHGTKSGIMGVDEKSVPIASITGLFTADKCPSLLNKPKVFIIQACRGNKDDFGAVTSDADVISPSTIQSLPVESDFLISYACPLGYSSYRDEEIGSWYIQSLVNKLNEFYTKEHLMDILLRVNFSVASQSCDSGYKQIPSQECRLTKKCFFAAE